MKKTCKPSARIAVLLLAFLLALTLLTGCMPKNTPAPADTSSQPVDDTPATVSFTDSSGRTVEIPSHITRVTPSGAVATMFLLGVCPEYLVSINATPADDQIHYFPQQIASLPATGQLYGSKSTLNLEELLACDPQIVIDLGDYKKGIADDLDALQAQIGIPVIFIQADLDHMEEAFRTLGRILEGKESRGNELADYVKETLALADANRAKLKEDEVVSAMYTSGASGLDTNCKGSTQAQVLERVGVENAVVLETVSNKGGGNTINMEQLYQFDPDVILFTTGSIFSSVAEDSTWKNLTAIRNDSYYEIPGVPYNWLSNPPSLNMILGIRWLGALLYPQYYTYDMKAEAQRFYKLMWGYTLSDAEVNALLAGSIVKARAAK